MCVYVCGMVGIAIEDQPQLFQQFAQFNRNALQGGGGSGLGLWICKNLSKFHGGRLVTRIYRLLTSLISSLDTNTTYLFR